MMKKFKMLLLLLFITISYNQLGFMCIFMVGIVLFSYFYHYGSLQLYSLAKKNQSEEHKYITDYHTD